MVRVYQPGGAGGGGAGTVTSVGLAMPAIFSVAGSPVTTAGTITVSLATQSANRVFAGPTSGGAAAPTFRALVAADLPVMVGDAGAGGTAGAVPAPAAGDATKFLRGDATWVAISGTGTVTSVALTMPAIFSVAGSPVTTSGTLAVTLANQSANQVFAGPTSGGAAAPAFRSLVADDYPTMVGDAGAGGTKGAVPAPAAGDAAAGKFLKADGTWAAPAGSGTVTSVGLSAPAQFSVTGSPVTTTGTLALAWVNQDANKFLGGPSSGGAAAPTFRLLVADDYVTMVGDSGAGGTKGAVPAPAAGDAAAGKFLKADGTWAVPAGGSAAWESAGGQFKIKAASITAGDQVYIKSEETTAADAVANLFDTTNSLATTSSNRSIFSIANAGDQCVHVIRTSGSDGSSYSSTAILLSGSASGTSVAPSNTTPYLGMLACTRSGIGAAANYITLGFKTSTTGILAYGAIDVGLCIERSVAQIEVVGCGLGIPAGQILGLDVGNETLSDSGFTKSASSGGNMDTKYDNAVVVRDDGTNIRFLQSRKPGLYTAIGDATALLTFGGCYKVNSTPVGNVGTGEDDLQTQSLPGGALSETGDRVEIVAFGTTAPNGNNKTIKLYFGSTVLFSTGAVALNGVDWMIRATVIRTGAATQVTCAGFFGDTVLVPQTATTSGATETLSGAVTIKTTGEATSNDDILSQGLIVDVFPVQ